MPLPLSVPRGVLHVFLRSRETMALLVRLSTCPAASQGETTAVIDVFQALTVILIACALAPGLAHALELPCKLRLTKEAYFAMQPIYYPGFTIAGMSELLASSPRSSSRSSRRGAARTSG